jgi:hypothetical protein
LPPPAAVIGLGGIAMTSVPASAAVVCNGDTCWHTHSVYHYPPGIGVVVRTDHWHWGLHDHSVWHEHTGRGYSQWRLGDLLGGNTGLREGGCGRPSFRQCTDFP